MKKYELGTQIIYKELWKAAAAAKLWGHHQLVAMLKGKKLSSYYSAEYLGFLYWYCGDQWHITIDTPEKQDWFMPQIGDLFYFEKVQGDPDDHLSTGIVRNIGRQVLVQCLGDTSVEHLDLEGIARIIERNNTPFPTPCEVIEP